MSELEALRLAEHLEKVWHQYEAAAELRRLAHVEAQRDALLEALQYMLNVCPAIDAQGEEAHYQARTAIAKTEGAPA